jgi:hypothetical protein
VFCQRRQNARSFARFEAEIDGDFEGWEGETIVKLTNGQIWQQTEYYYTYHYAFMPNVMIFKSGGGFKMRVDVVEKPVGVSRLKCGFLTYTGVVRREARRFLRSTST